MSLADGDITTLASLILVSIGRVSYYRATCHVRANPARGFSHGLLAPFPGDLEGGRPNIATLSCRHSILVSVTARSRGGSCSSRPHGTFREHPGGDGTGRSFSCGQQRAGLPSSPPRVLWGVALLHPPLRPASQPGVLPSCPTQRLPEELGQSRGPEQFLGSDCVRWFNSVPVDG